MEKTNGGWLGGAQRETRLFALLKAVWEVGFSKNWGHWGGRVV
jgi:hypothetical protein